eukprot:238562-Prymnesium_polylepis.1
MNSPSVSGNRGSTSGGKATSIQSGTTRTESASEATSGLHAAAVEVLAVPIPQRASEDTQPP